MPRDKKKRGRREEKKRQREEESFADGTESVKRPRFDYNGYGNTEVEPLYEEQEVYGSYGQNGHQELPFYGLLDEQEQAYFRQADSTLDLNQFVDAEEKDLFLNNLWKEVKGKELKIANGQSCSRLMERLIAASSSIQLKELWQKFNSHFLNLFQHRFASHCCEALFRKAASFIAVDMGAPANDIAIESLEVGGAKVPSTERLFLDCVKELDGNFGYLMTDRFASHPLRVLLVVLSGLPLENTETRSLLQSKKKEQNVASKEEITPEGRVVVPESFQAAIEDIIAGSTANIDTNSLRALASHPVANPVLQLLLTISLTRSSKSTALKDPRSLFRVLIPEDPPAEDTESAAFINHLLYDPIGSRLLEAIITHAPGKTFKSLFHTLFKSKLPTLSRNETASFVVAKIISRLSTADLESALPQLCTEIPTLIHRSRTHVLRILVTRCQARSISTTLIATALQTAYATKLDLRQMLDLPTQPDSNMSVDRQKLLQETSRTKSTYLDNSLLLQTLLTTPGPLRAFATTAILASDTPTLIEVASDRTSSRVLQAALTSPSSPATADDIKFLRLLIPSLLPHIVELATHAVASHVIDALWDATSPTGLGFLREQIATELIKGEQEIRGSLAGKAVWRNWNMEIFKNRRRDWAGLPGKKEGGDGSGAAREKTGIELARERHAQKRAKGGQALGGRGGPNAKARLGVSGSPHVAQRA